MDEITPQPSRPRRRRRLAALLVLTLVSGTVGVGAMSLAIFTDSKAVAGNAFTTGTVVLGVNPATALLTSGAMMPGDVVNGSLVVSNTGTAALRYAMTSAWTNADAKNLMNQLTLEVRSIGTGCAAFTGPVLYTGAANGALFGLPAQGNDPGDRTLAAAASETLCFRATLPLATGNTFQNATTTGTFTFSAEQTANNP